MKIGRSLAIITVTILFAMLVSQKELQVVSASLSEAFPPWSAVTVDGAEGQINQTSLVLDSNDYPHILYSEYPVVLKYTKFDGLSWTNETIHTAGFSGRDPRITLDSKGYPHIAWLADHDAHYGYYDGSSWHLFTICQGCWPGYISLALDSNDRPHLSFYKDTNDDLYYARLDGSSWHVEQVDGSSYFDPTSTALAIDSQDRPHIAYAVYHDRAVKHAWYDGDWHIETVSDNVERFGPLSVALDSFDRPHIALADRYLEKLYYFWNDGNFWHEEYVDEAFYARVSLKLDSSDRPHVGFLHDDGVDYYVKYASNNGSGWSVETVGVGRGSSLALDKTGQPHISYYDTAAGALMYAVREESGTGPNNPPTAVDDAYSTDEDVPLTIAPPGILANDSDVDGDTVFVESHSPVGNGTVTVNPDGSFSYTPNANFNGLDAFDYVASDGNGGTDTAIVTITVNPVNDPPVITPDNVEVTVAEGETASNSGTVSDIDNDSVALSASVGTVINHDDGTWSWTFETKDGPAESQMVTVVADDGSDPRETSFELVVNNVAPNVGEISASQAPVQVNTEIQANANFTDPGLLDTHTAIWGWGDGSTSDGIVNESNGSGSVSGNHTYETPGVYTVELIVTDKDGGFGNSSFQYVVVYDPEGGFVTGGGWIDSPEGACAFAACAEDTSGKATFGFVSKYKKGADVPTGQTEFQFKAGNLDFHSSSYQWLVVAGHKAQFKGEGTINGEGSYGFMLTAIDEELTPSTDVDMFRIKIWDKDSDVTVYDNQMGEGDNSDAATAIGGGSIVIHQAK